MTSLKLLHDVKKWAASISACKCARALISFLFLWFLWWLNSTWLLSLYLHVRITSRNDVMTTLNMLYLSQLVDVLGKWFFFVSMVIWVAKFKNIIDFVFSYVVMSQRDAMTSWHDYMMSQNSFHLYQRVGWLDRWFDRCLCIHGYLDYSIIKCRCLIRKCHSISTGMMSLLYTVSLYDITNLISLNLSR